jgi:hypothetical protein
MNMASNDIASIMNVSMQSLRNTRMRLRQRLSLEGSQKIEVYIRKLLEESNAA